jgi:hypothetical protein
MSEPIHNLHIHRMTTGVRPFDTDLFSESQL